MGQCPWSQPLHTLPIRGEERADDSCQSNFCQWGTDLRMLLLDKFWSHCWPRSLMLTKMNLCVCWSPLSMIAILVLPTRIGWASRGIWGCSRHYGQAVGWRVSGHEWLHGGASQTQCMPLFPPPFAFTAEGHTDKGCLQERCGGMDPSRVTDPSHCFHSQSWGCAMHRCTCRLTSILVWTYEHGAVEHLANLLLKCNPAYVRDRMR